MSLKKAFQLVDFRCTGLIDRHQFEELLCGTLLNAMAESHLNSAWSKTATVKARRCGYRLCDPADQRELCEIVPWFISGEDRKTGWKASVGHASLKLGRALSCKAGKTKRRAENRVFLRTRPVGPICLLQKLKSTTKSKIPLRLTSRQRSTRSERWPQAVRSHHCIGSHQRRTMSICTWH